MNRTYPKPEPKEPPFFLDPQLWFRLLMITGMILGLITTLYVVIVIPENLNCGANPNNELWTQLCNNWYNQTYGLFGMVGGTFAFSLIMYFVSRYYITKGEDRIS